MDKFQIVAKLGEGCFGTVYRAVNTETAAPVALKVVPLQRLQDGLPDAPVRELLSLQHLADSPRVVRLHEAFPCGGALVFVLELCRGDYAGILRRQPGWCGLPLAVAKCLADQLLEALDDIHSRGVVHRDVKPGNVLLDARGTAKLGDFGLARLAEPCGDWTHEVATRWYRAPELLFGARDYGPGVDMWGAGCVVAELIAGGGSGVLFPGTGDIDQIAKIFRVLGTPSPETHPTLTALPDWGKVEFAAQPGTGLGAVLPRACPLALDLLGRLLSLEPQRRISAANARRHPFFFTAPLPAVAAEVVLPPPLPRAPSVAAIIDGATRRGRPAAVTTGPLHLWTHTALPFEQAPV